MPVNGAVLYDLWDGEQIEGIRHSRLYHQEPIGVGSPMVESLTSYLTRLTEAHSVHLRVLVTDEILPRLNQSHLYQDERPVYDHLTRFWKQSSTLNGTSMTSSDWVQTLEQLTLRRDLSFLTMLTFANVLSSRGLLRRTQGWCPACYEEWRETDQVIYQPLLWALEVIHVCPRHGLRLHLRCPYADCGHELTSLAPRSQTGYCTQCERWLGSPLQYEGNGQGSSVEEQEWQRWVGTVVGELLAAAADFLALPRKEVIAATITKHVQSAMDDNFSAFARKLQVHRRTAWEWGQGMQIPQLDTLLQICAYLGTSPRDLFMGKALDGEKCKAANKPLVEKSTRRVRKFETEKIQLALEAVLQGDEFPPPSMRKVAQHLNYDQSHLRKHFPDLCHAISARHRAYQQEQRLSRIRRTRDEVQQAARILNEHGSSLSERQVGKMLGKRGVFKEDEVRVVLKKRCRQWSGNDDLRPFLV